jgi:hypothetical protein
MKALVVYESLYGNTAAIGEAIAASLRDRGIEAESRAITHVEPAETDAFDLLVLGGPTHAHGMSREATRKTGAEDKKNTYAEPTRDPGLREWIPRLPLGGGRPAAAFDTRFDKPAFLTGSAAKGIAHRLEGRGYHLVAVPESFFVTTEGHLEGGQTEHATAWGAALAEAVSVGARRSA